MFVTATSDWSLRSIDDEQHVVYVVHRTDGHFLGTAAGEGLDDLLRDLSVDCWAKPPSKRFRVTRDGVSVDHRIVSQKEALGGVCFVTRFGLRGPVADGTDTPTRWVAELVPEAEGYYKVYAISRSGNKRRVREFG